jgi:hypothetical protein
MHQMGRIVEAVEDDTADPAALDETNGNVRATREFSGRASIEVLMRYDDNRRDVGGEVATKVISRVAKLFNDKG